MLELEKIGFTAKGRTGAILKNVSINFPEGSFITITGPNGSGKSTLAKIIMGILAPTSGKVFLENEDITKLSITERAKKGLAFGFQQPANFKGLNVREILEIAAGRELEEKELKNLLAQVGLESEEYLEREVGATLSGGELKRIEIATVLAREAKILIFDEPEAGIDLWSFKNLTTIFKKMKEMGKTIIVISHQERILKLADQVIILKNGEIAEEKWN